MGSFRLFKLKYYITASKEKFDLYDLRTFACVYSSRCSKLFK